MSFTIREANSNDYIGVNALVKEVHELHVKNRPDVYVKVDTPLLIQQFNELMEDVNIKLFVVQDNENSNLAAYAIVKIINTQSLHIVVPQRFAYIDDFCVKSNYKGKGLGKLLFQHLSNYAKEAGASSLQLAVWEFNKDAIEFYEKMGMSTRNRRMELSL